MENQPFEDVFPIENGDFPLLCLITGVYIQNPPVIPPDVRCFWEVMGVQPSSKEVFGCLLGGSSHLVSG